MAWLEPQRGARDQQQVHYVILRGDLPAGVAMAMCVHAAGETGPAAVGTIAVVLMVRDEAELLALVTLNDNLRFHVVREPDPPYGNQALAVALPPGPRRRELRKLGLWRPRT